jgi:hypothetical protein
METKFELHPDLQDASLEKACELADQQVRCNRPGTAVNLSYMLEYLRLNFDLVPKPKK